MVSNLSTCSTGAQYRLHEQEVEYCHRELKSRCEEEQLVGARTPYAVQGISGYNFWYPLLARVFIPQGPEWGSVVPRKSV